MEASLMKRVDLTGKTFGDLKVIRYLGNKRWECQCSCGKILPVLAKSLLHDGKTSCGHKALNSQLSDLKYNLLGQKFGEWEVKEYCGNQIWLCQCSCGTLRKISSQHLRYGQTKSCGHNTTAFKDLTDKQFGDWTAKKYLGNQMWLCQCSCGKTRAIRSADLTSGKSRSCGHSTTVFKDLTGKTFGDWEVLYYCGAGMYWCRCSCGVEQYVSGRSLRAGTSKSCGHGHTLDLTGQTFWEWTALEYVGDHLWRCQCSCGTIREIPSLRLRSGVTKSCGCKKTKHLEETIRSKFGINNISQLHLSQDQVTMTSSKENLRQAILLNFRSNPTPKELYYPEQKLAIEFNGSYWHSSLFKDRIYHQKKTVLAGKQGVHLIHVFEYEWNNPDKRRKLIDLIDRYLNRSSMVVIGARKCEIKDIDKSSAHDFLNLYHLQNFAPASIYLGCYYESELVGVMAFGKPRFNSRYDYELIRLCWKSGVIVTGGSQRMLKYFIDRYKPSSIITYCDISKFNGNSYVKMGFSFVEMTRPNYVWINLSDNRVISRYQTTKQKLIAKGLGKPDQTENEIMENLGFLKIYDCGNFKFLWKAQKQEVS